MIAYHIHIEGQVQGVGFRPYVWRLAKEFYLSGWVSNGVDGVHIEICGDERLCRKFYYSLVHNAPQSARITRHAIYEIENEFWTDFQIRESNEDGVPTLLVTPDLGMCHHCREEIEKEGNTRYHYAFTTCTQCGPRYSILQKLPYDRANTTMKDFVMCETCGKEFQSPADRRYFSQTNSCPNCAIQLELLNSSGHSLTTTTEIVLQLTTSALKEGKVVAMKGIGGFLLLADATNEQAVNLLRHRKHRPTKPFALLYPSLEILCEDAFITEDEQEALQSIEAPIVLVQTKQNPKSNLALSAIAPQLDHIGAMLPYTPLMALLMKAWKSPLIATSGNESGSPIFYDNEQALHHLNNIADFFIINNRDITLPQDDSVVRFTKEHQRIIIRRSRGLAPTFLPHPFVNESKTWLAMGGDMKSAFALLNQRNVYISQFLGDLENFQSQESFEHTLSHWRKMLDADPTHVLVDKHPVYFSSMLGKKITRESRLSPILVQHHHAHFSAVLAENNLLESNEPVLGVIWDGTGWGDDGNIWGGEFFVYESGAIERLVHLDYFDHFLGDKVSREPRLCAMSLCKNIPEAEELLKPKFSFIEWNLYKTILEQKDLLQTSSIGRLFDGVASLLGLCDISSYEGEAAMYLEALASKAPVENALPRARWNTGKHFSLQNAMRQLVDEIKRGTPKEIIAYHFHQDLVQWIAKVATRQGISKIAFSGGVFQNALLVDLIHQQLSDHHQLYFHDQLSPNDENIALGQLAWLYIQQHVLKSNEAKRKTEYQLI